MYSSIGNSCNSVARAAVAARQWRSKQFPAVLALTAHFSWCRVVSPVTRAAVLRFSTLVEGILSWPPPPPHSSRRSRPRPYVAHRSLPADVSLCLSVSVFVFSPELLLLMLLLLWWVVAASTLLAVSCSVFVTLPLPPHLALVWSETSPGIFSIKIINQYWISVFWRLVFPELIVFSGVRRHECV